MASLTVGVKARTLNNSIVKIIGGSLLNYCDTGLLGAKDPIVILAQCENESGDTEYWLASQLIELPEEEE
ncbi:hypothetical protein [Enterococcus gallinarum]|uniref:hypothetical protein n=1 Tax=Enterococcus gallinarum TaxID=1353 RepID=UPI0018ABE1FA|nr:hypothetical protein [Enterococcus gallinarum]